MIRNNLLSSTPNTPLGVFRALCSPQKIQNTFIQGHAPIVCKAARGTVVADVVCA